VDKTLRPSLALAVLLHAGVSLAAPAEADGSGLAPELAQQVQALAVQAGHRATDNARVEVEVGQLDPRLHLAPCQRVEPYLPAGSKPWGKTRVGLRCRQGPTAWNVFLPVTVKVYGRALVATGALPAGATLAAADLKEAEVDLAAGASAALSQPATAVGRVLARPLSAGDTVRQADLRARQYFSAGETVQVLAAGPGYQVSGEGQALSAGLEGQLVRVRTETGRIVTGQAVAEHRVEIPL
jgi:flagella basal body P-ring formation protein FlgA